MPDSIRKGLQVKNRTVQQTDEELVAASIAGRSRAFDELVLRHQQRLYHALTKILRDREEAFDVVQEAFVQAWRKLADFRGQAGFYSWLFRIAYNTAMSRQRKKKLPMSSADRIPPRYTPEDGHPTSQPSHRMELKERQQGVQQALDSLPEEYRTVLILKELEQFKYEQIAELLEVPVGTIRSRIHRARLLFRQKLLQELPDAEEFARISGNGPVSASEPVPKLESPEMS